MTPREFGNACKGYNNKLEVVYKYSWEQARFLGVIQANMFSKKRLQPRDLIKFPWDVEADYTEELKKIEYYRSKIKKNAY